MRVNPTTIARRDARSKGAKSHKDLFDDDDDDLRKDRPERQSVRRKLNGEALDVGAIKAIAAPPERRGRKLEQDKSKHGRWAEPRDG